MIKVDDFGSFNERISFASVAQRCSSILLCSTNRLHAIQFAELATAKFLHSIHPAKIAVANLANAVLAGIICSAKTANSGKRLT